MEGESAIGRDRPERFALWRGYAPTRRAADGSVVPLTPLELRGEAARFIDEVDRAQREGDLLRAQRFRRAAAIFQSRATRIEASAEGVDLTGRGLARPPADDGRTQPRERRARAR